jgi:hypothetical protein
MTVRMDPRLEARRRWVREQAARSSTRRLLWVMAALALVAGSLWLVNSPVLAVSDLIVHGARTSDVQRILEDQGVVVGRPLVAIRPGPLEEALRADPWVAEARVDVIFPDTVEVRIVEREPLVWLAGSSGWTLVATDAVLLERGGQPGTDDYVISLDVPPGNLGAVSPDPRVIGAVEFLLSLSPDVEGGVTITERDAELWATVGDVSVRLGRPVAMAAKAVALVAVLEEGVEDGSTIILLAPTRPAVIPPPDLDNLQPQEEP